MLHMTDVFFWGSEVIFYLFGFGLTTSTFDNGLCCLIVESVNGRHFAVRKSIKTNGSAGFAPIE